MDFFNAQRQHKRRSLQLYGLFFVVVGIHALVLLGFFALMASIFTGSVSYWLLIAVLLVTLASFLLGSLIEYNRLRAGGRAIAKRVGAVRLFIDHSVDQIQVSRGLDTSDPRSHAGGNLLPKVLYRPHQIVVRDPKDFPSEYRRYYEFAEQMAIAAGIRPPILYVLPDERGINGFVAGREAEDTVMVLTQGALESLTDEGLYGLIAHEYGHILHGDARFNLHLMVVLAGLQLLYDWTDPIDSCLSPSGDYARRVTQQQQALKQQLAAQLTMPSQQLPSQSIVDRQARHIEAQTAGLEDDQWVAYWRQQAQSPTALAQQIQSISGERTLRGRSAQNNDFVTLLLHLFSFSSMLSAQLIKHSFNRQRELLADATSVQLTRSPAIMETLRTIHQSPLGSRLSVTPETHGLSHFFFASSSSVDLGDSSWFSTHPSIRERMQAIDQGDYETFARKVAEQRRVNQQAIKDIYEQRRRGTWQMLKEPNTDGSEAPPLDFTPTADVVVDGRLVTEGFEADLRADAGFEQQLYPYAAKPDAELPKGSIDLSAIKRITLPQRINDYTHHPLGAVGLIEALLLCHQYRCIDAYEPVTLSQLWQGQSSRQLSISLPNNASLDLEPLKSETTDDRSHSLNVDLLDLVSRLDRRMDSGLIERSCQRLAQHNLSSQALLQLDQRHAEEHSHAAAREYQSLKKRRDTLTHYLRALEATIIANGPDCIGLDGLSGDTAGDARPMMQRLAISPLWLAGHLYLFIEAAQSALATQWQGLDDQAFIDQHLSHQRQRFAQIISEMAEGTGAHPDIDKEPEGGGQTSAAPNLRALELSKLQLLALILWQQLSEAQQRQPQYHERLIASLCRLARLIDIPLVLIAPLKDQGPQGKVATKTPKANEILTALSGYTPSQVLGLILHIKHTIWAQSPSDSHANQQLEAWLRTFYTAVLNDAVLTQDEYDILTLLAYVWLGERRLIE